MTTVAERLIDGVDMVTVHVSDLDRAREFYGGLLGLQEETVDTANGWVSYDIPGSEVGVGVHVMQPNEPGREPGTVSGVVFRVRDARRVAEEVASAGGRVTDQPEETPWGTVSATIADPDGNEFIISSPQEGA